MGSEMCIRDRYCIEVCGSKRWLLCLVYGWQCSYFATRTLGIRYLRPLLRNISAATTRSLTSLKWYTCRSDCWRVLPQLVWVGLRGLEVLQVRQGQRLAPLSRDGCLGYFETKTVKLFLWRELQQG